MLFLIPFQGLRDVVKFALSKDLTGAEICLIYK